MRNAILLVAGGLAATAALITACTSTRAVPGPTTVVTAAGPTVTAVQTQVQTTVATHTEVAVRRVSVTTTPTVVKTVATKTRVRTVTYTPPPPHQFGAGEYLVGRDIHPGTYQTGGSGDCYWARLSGLSGDLGDVLANGIGPGPHIVTVYSSDKAFQVQGGCTFHRA
jgi:hypothetical protein